MPKKRGEFFYKKHKGEACIFVKQENGFVGRADEVIRATLPFEFVAFQAALKEYGEEKAKKVCLEEGELHFVYDPRPAPAVKRDLEAAEADVKDLKEELEKAEAVEKKEGVKKEVKKEVKKSPKPTAKPSVKSLIKKEDK